MGMNFGYNTYGMMNGMNMMGAMPLNTTYSRNVNIDMKQKYGCEHCFNPQVTSYYPVNTNPISNKTYGPSFLTRLIRKFTGG